MNALSWLIYAADVVREVNAICGVIFFGGLIAMALYSFGKGAARFANYGFDAEPITPSLATVAKKIWLPVLAAGIIGAIVPSSGTIYAIAASEMGEEVLNSETGGKAVEALNAWLDRQIAGKPSA